MMFQILLNLLVAIVWMLLQDKWSAPAFATGYSIAFLFIFALRRFFPTPFYGKRLWAIIKLCILFFIELVKSSLMVIGQVTRPRINIRPGIIRMDTKLTGEWEITILSCMITLTPGSVVFEIDPVKGILYVHAIDVSNDYSWLLDTKNAFEKAILEVTS